MSVGWASLTPEASSMDELLAEADRMMYLDKQRRNSRTGDLSKLIDALEQEPAPLPEQAAK